MDKYDSTQDTRNHIRTVQWNIWAMIYNLISRLRLHDRTKLEQPEKEIYDRFTPLLRKVEYNSDSYKALLLDMGEALRHHYHNNDHHPENHENGIDDMSLMAISEMLADWYSSCLRTKNGNMLISLETNKKRFNISDQLYNILLATIKELGWDKQ